MSFLYKRHSKIKAIKKQVIQSHIYYTHEPRYISSTELPHPQTVNRFNLNNYKLKYILI